MLLLNVTVVVVGYVVIVVVAGVGRDIIAFVRSVLI